jgi:hypothetical protein
MVLRSRRLRGLSVLIGILILWAFVVTLTVLRLIVPTPAPVAVNSSQLLTDPFLQLPTANSVRVVWLTEFEGQEHQVWYGDRFQSRQTATSQRLTRLREDADSPIPNPPPRPTFRPIWRHEALITGLTPGQSVPYLVYSQREDGMVIKSDRYSLAAAPNPGTPLNILLTSDHQLKTMTAANLQQVTATVGSVDAVFHAGDLVNIPDRASEWFDSTNGNAFFPCLQGRARTVIEQTNGSTVTYTGSPIIQNAPLFPALGNHEVMGRFSMVRSLNDQYNDPFPRAQAAQFAPLPPTEAALDPHVQTAWLKAHSYNSDTYETLFTLPSTSPGDRKYYAVSFGDIRLVSLYVTHIWRRPTVDDGPVSRYREPSTTAPDPSQWSYGQHIFEPITPDSEQYQWLQAELNSPAFQGAKYKIVMLHHPPHSLGDNVVPAFTDPQPVIEREAGGAIAAVRYEYPLDQDYIHQYLEPLWNAAGVDLVFYGHSHLWNRFQNEAGVHFLESSNVGNTYGAYLSGGQQRDTPPDYTETYAPHGDPNGLAPIIPTLDPLLDPETQQPLPYLASNTITAFSILDTSNGSISSYRFDTTNATNPVVKFDEFFLNP